MVSDGIMLIQSFMVINIVLKLRIQVSHSFLKHVLSKRQVFKQNTWTGKKRFVTD